MVRCRRGWEVFILCLGECPRTEGREICEHLSQYCRQASHGLIGGTLDDYSGGGGRGLLQFTFTLLEVGKSSTGVVVLERSAKSVRPLTPNSNVQLQYCLVEERKGVKTCVKIEASSVAHRPARL